MSNVSDIKPWFREDLARMLMIVVWREEKMSYAGNEDWEGIFEKHKDNPAVATRLAIVKEAAKIGRKM